jgi:hypothetical protein
VRRPASSSVQRAVTPVGTSTLHPGATNIGRVRREDDGAGDFGRFTDTARGVHACARSPPRITSRRSKWASAIVRAGHNLLWHFLEPMTGIEPAYSAWEAISTPERVNENRWSAGDRANPKPRLNCSLRGPRSTAGRPGVGGRLGWTGWIQWCQTSRMLASMTSSSSAIHWLG